jgi:flotillin
VISNSENGSGSGASKITRDVTEVVAQLPVTIEALTGIDLGAALRNLPGLKTSDGDGSGESETSDTAEK